MAWDAKPKLTKLNKISSLVEKVVDIEIKKINEKLEKVDSVLKAKKKHEDDLGKKDD